MRSVAPMKAAKIGCFIMSGLQFVLGIVLIAWPMMSATILCRLLGAGLLAYGIVRIVGYCSRDLYRLAFQFDLAFGILWSAVGLILLLRPAQALSLVMLLVDILVLADGLFKLQTALDAKGFGVRRWWLVLAVAVLAGIAGVLLIVHPDAGLRTAMVLLGICLAVDAVLGFVVAFLLIKIVRHQKPDIIDAERIDVE